jgi:hypothetical protein
MEPFFHVFRHNADDAFQFVGSAQSLESSRELVRLQASEPKKQFVIYDVLTHEITYLRAEDVVE